MKLLKGLFDLTPAEARLFRDAPGHSGEDGARLLGQIFRKTGTSQLSQLAPCCAVRAAGFNLILSGRVTAFYFECCVLCGDDLLAGDEFARTQHGNNNAYCQSQQHR